MMQKLLPACAAIALVTACGANPWVVDSYQSPEGDVAGRRSFVWKAGEVGAPLIRQPQAAADTETRMHAAVARQLQQKGYVETGDASGADMVVSFQVTGTRRYVPSDERRVGAPSPDELLTPGNVPPPPASELPREKSIREGTLVVFAEDPASGRLLWRGLVNVEVRTSSVAKTVDQLIDMGGHITQGFPARRTTP